MLDLYFNARVCLVLSHAALCSCVRFFFFFYMLLCVCVSSGHAF